MPSISYHTKQVGNYEIRGARAIDGDTIEAILCLPFQTLVQKRIRIAGWWAPELDGPNHGPAEWCRGELQRLLDTTPCYIVSRSERLDKYGRIIAALFSNGKAVPAAQVLGIWSLTEAQHREELKSARLGALERQSRGIEDEPGKGSLPISWP